MPGALDDHLSATGRSSLFDAVEQAAAQVGLAMFVVRVDTPPPTVVFASELLARFVARPAAELVGRPPWELVAPEQRERVRTIIASRGPGAPPITLQFEIERPDGTRLEIEVGVARITASDAELAVCYFRDVTEVHATAEALRRSEMRFRSLIELAPDGVVILRAGGILLANLVAARMFGSTDPDAVRGRPLSDYLPPDDLVRAGQRMARILEGAALGPSEYRVIADQERIVEVHSIPCDWEGAQAILAVVRDVTERKRLHEELIRSDRLAVVGTLAAAVAHEVNNPMTYLQLSLKRLERMIATEPDPERAAAMHDCVRDAQHGAERVTSIVRDLRTFAKDDVGSFGLVDVIAVVDRAIKMVEHDLRHRARLIRRYPEEPPVIFAIAGRVEQIMVNLLINAIQALPVRDAAQNEIVVDIRVTDDVRIAVRDNGVGIAAEDLQRVFEPFFTTKRTGEGTGLGLAVCKRIVDDLGGGIEISSAPGEGTELAVTFPLSSPETAAPPPAAPRPVVARRRVLVIDDEPLVGRTLQRVLELDHDVDTVERGADALDLLGRLGYDVILCDLMMQGMNGREVYDQICVRFPGVERRVVFVTGGAFVPELAEYLDRTDNLKLLKPFTVEEVLAVVHAAATR